MNTNPQNKTEQPAISDRIELGDPDIWDDTLLIKAYNDSLKLAKEEVAKRIASSTNRIGECDLPTLEHEKPEMIRFQRNDYVRCTYDDGIDYEAVVMEIDETLKNTCTIKYIGYNNEQVVEMQQLIPSWGKKARKKQKMEAANAAPPQQSLNKNIEFNYLNQSSMTLPPPPPMPPMLEDLTEDSEHLSAMLMSWYMSGYYTGLYHGQKQQAQKSKTNWKH